MRMRRLIPVLALCLVAASCSGEADPDESPAAQDPTGEWQLISGSLDDMPIDLVPGYRVTMNFAADGPPFHLVIVLVAFFVVCVITYFCFVGGKAITRFLGKNLIMVISRIMGLILAVVGTQMLIDGIRAAARAGA